MEYLIGLGVVAAAGHYMNGKNDPSNKQYNTSVNDRQQFDMNKQHNDSMVQKNLMNQQTNMEEPQYYNMAKGEEHQRVSEFHQNSQFPTKTNQIPYGMNQNLRNNAQKPGNNFIEQMDNMMAAGGNGMVNNGQPVFSELSGRAMDSQEFRHNNMVPFFRGREPTQSTETFRNQATLDFHTGRDMFYHPKKESKNLFAPTPDLDYVCGVPAQEDRQLERYIPSNLGLKTNELPFEKIKVGPGLNQGYSAAPRGGFHDFDQRDYAMPKSTDQLRTANNPKLQYKGRIVSGKSQNDTRGIVGEVIKHKPDAFYINEGVERAFTTVGAYSKDTQRPTVLVKDTNRQCTSQNEYTGTATATTNKQNTLRSKIKQSTRQNYYTDGVRNLNATEHWTDYNTGDYGKKALFLPAQERDITQQRTHVSNVSSTFKEIVAPVMDAMKTTRKENVVGNPNAAGYAKTAIFKGQVYDPNDVAKTTIKETLIHDERTGNYHRGVTLKPTVYDPNDVARTTMKETLIHDDRTGNFDRSVVQDGQGYLTNEQEAPNTNRQFTSNWEYEGIANGDIAKGGGGEGYLTNDKEAPNTNKQFTSDYEYVGGAMSTEPSQMRYNHMYAARLNEVREGTLVGRDPTPSNVSLTNGMDKLNMEIKKLDGDRVNSREMSKTKIYNSIPQYNPCQVTNNKDQLDNDTIYDRNNPEILNAFRDNPYTQSLQSFTRSHMNI
jgi:hypothetical protein